MDEDREEDWADEPTYVDHGAEPDKTENLRLWYSW